MDVYDVNTFKRYQTMIDASIQSYIVTIKAMSKNWYLMDTHRDNGNIISEWEHLSFHEPSWRNNPNPI